MSPSKDIGIADLPNQRHKIVSKAGANYTVMVVGESGLGKTTFVNTLFTTSIKEYRNPMKRFQKQIDRTVDITITKADLEEKSFNMRLNIVDTPGFGDFVNNRDSWLAIVDFIDNQYDSYMRQEQQPTRQGKIDLRVHVCVYFIRPTGHGLKPLDIQAMKEIGQRCNLIPVIAKADTITVDELAALKEKVRVMIKENDIQVYKITKGEEDDETEAAQIDRLMSAMPFAVVGSESQVVTKDGRNVKGREYPWGIVEVENEAHCDFTKLRDLLVRTNMLDLINSTEEVHYDNYRLAHMDNPIGPKSSQLAIRFKEEEEQLRKRFTEQVKQEENRFRQWETKLIAERDRLNKDLEAEHSYIKSLESEVDVHNHTGRR